MASETDAGRYLIHKAGRGWYRPDAQGYTLDPRQAGRYSFDEAVAHSHPNGPFGPRDGITVKNESEVDGACPAPEYAGLVEQDEYDIAAAATNHADKVLRAAGSALKHYTTPSIKKAILSAMLDAIEEAYRAGADLVIARTSALTERNKALEVEAKALREAVKVLRDGYKDAESGLQYVLQEHGRLSGVGFDRVFDHYFQWVTMPEREGLLAGSHVLPRDRP